MNPDNHTNSNNQDLRHKLLSSVTGSWMAQAAYVAAELNIPDLLLEGPKTISELSNNLQTDKKALTKLLNALIAMGLCRKTDQDTFTYTEMGLLLTENSPDSLRSWIIWWGSNLWEPWGNLLYSVRTGNSSREHLTGKSGFKHLENNPEQAKVFNSALVELTRMAAKDIINSYNFSKHKIIADIGGGFGELLIAILKKNNDCSGLLFDLPKTVKEAKKRFRNENLTARCEFVEGDFFKSFPDNADAYILKSVLHDWNREKCLHILGNCRKVMNQSNTLLLAEQILPDQFSESIRHQSLARSDLTMLIAHGAGERTELEYRELLEETGFKIIKILPAGYTFSIIEAEPV